jgi:hypothetical protein
MVTGEAEISLLHKWYEYFTRKASVPVHVGVCLVHRFLRALPPDILYLHQNWYFVIGNFQTF